MKIITQLFSLLLSEIMTPLLIIVIKTSTYPFEGGSVWVLVAEEQNIASGSGYEFSSS